MATKTKITRKWLEENGAKNALVNKLESYNCISTSNLSTFDIIIGSMKSASQRELAKYLGVACEITIMSDTIIDLKATRRFNALKQILPHTK